MIELEHDEVYSRVQRNPHRPFVVHACAGATTVLGATFEVPRFPKHFQVRVREGAVEVASLKRVTICDDVSQAAAQWVPVRLARDEEMTYDARVAAAWPGSRDI